MKRTKLLWTLFISVLFGACSLVGINYKLKNPKKEGSYPGYTNAVKLLGEPSKYRNCFDVKHQLLNITINDVEKSISGEVTLTSVATSAIDTFQIDLHKNHTVRSVRIAGSEQKFFRKENAVFIICKEKIPAQTVFSVIIIYEGKPPIAAKPPWSGGFVWKKDKYKNTWAGVACESEGANIWWPCKDMVSDEADSTDILLNVPKNLTAVSNGVLMDTLTKNNLKTFHWKISYPINNYNITFYLGDYSLIQDIYVSEITGKTIELNYYVLPDNTDIAKKHFKQTKDYLAAYESLFGPYPWYNDGFKLVESPYAGMEHQTAIAYGNGYKNDILGMDYIILHETAHEWWGNSVSAADLAHAWIHEGFATYSEALYVEKKFGKNEYYNYLQWQRYAINNKRPVVGPENRRWFYYKDGDIYMKGTWVLHTLRNVINNDSLFFDILKSFRNENHLKQITTNDFISFVNNKTGKNYNWFFNQYLYSRFSPELDYWIENNKFYYKFKFTNDDFKLPVTISFNNEMKYTVYPEKKVQILTLTEEIESFISPENHYLMRVKENKNLSKEADI